MKYETGITIIIIIALLAGLGIGFLTTPLFSEQQPVLDDDKVTSFECPTQKLCPECPPIQYILVQAENKTSEAIIKEYGDFDIQILKEQAERIVKKHNCFKQQYIIIGLSKWEDRLYGMEKNLRLVYDNEEKLHGWITFNLIYIKDRVDAQTVKINVDVSTGVVTCEMVNLTYVQQERFR